MSSDFDLIWGNRELLCTNKGYEPLIKITKNNKQKHPTTYAKTNGFSVRTNRDKYQSVGKLYTGNDERLPISLEKKKQKTFEMFGICIKSNGLLDIAKLAHQFNFELVEHNGLPKLLNGMVTSGTNSNQMTINNNLSKESKRYSIAYLLSAYLLYYKKQEFFSFKHFEPEEDLEVSYMARLLLIPESLLKVIYHNCDENIQLLANTFEVPYNVMEQRIKETKKLKGSILIKRNN